MEEDVFDKLRAQLELETWPSIYFFKFIVPNDEQKLAQATALFNGVADITLKPSRTGKYISVSAKALMLSAEDVIVRYEKAAKIKGLISL